MGRRLFDTSVLPRRRQRAITLPVSIALHAAVVSAALIVPMLGDHSLPEVAAAPPSVFFTPPATVPPALPPPALAHGPKGGTTAPHGPSLPTALLAPGKIPDTLPPDSTGADGLPNIGDPNGVDGGFGSGTPPGTIVGGLPTATAAAPTPVRISHGVREPRKLRYVPPVYPELARQIRLQGTVLVECTIDARGRIVNATVVQGNPLLNEAALAAVQQWVYTPTLLSGIPVPVLMQVSVTFALS